MNVGVVHPGGLTDCIIGSSINKAIRGKAPGVKVYWLVIDSAAKSLLKVNENIEDAMTLSEFLVKSISLDAIFNFSPEFKPQMAEMMAGQPAGFGFNFTEGSEKYVDVLYGNKYVKMNAFQVHFSIVGFKWHGESYDICYYPKSKSKKNRAGLAIANANLRNYVHDNLDLENMNPWIIPYKQNVLRKMDEINRCRHVVTDDILTFHLAVYLRKHVQFLDIIPRNCKLEFFGQGEIHPVPYSVLR